MTTLVFPGDSYDALSRAMLTFTDETCSLLLAESSADRLIVVERHPAPDLAYSARGPLIATLRPEFLVPIVQKAREAGQAVVFVHTHPADSKPPRFSVVDDKGEALLADLMARRVPDATHLAMVLSPGGCAARRLGAGEPVRVVQVGAEVRAVSGDHSVSTPQTTWDRQVRAFGEAGQARLRAVRTAIVGCGGTGSLVAQQLAHLGVAELTLIDPDVIDASNLNRVVGAGTSDLGRSKVEVAAEMIRRIGLGSKVKAFQADIRDEPTARLLTEVDAIVSCTDSHSSRAIINQVAYQYVIPAFDVGVAIGAKGGTVTYIAGRAQMLAPGLACLVCGNVLDAAAVRRELQTDEERAQDHYIVGGGEPQPAVVSINSTMASLLVTMFLGAFAGVPARARLQYYDGLQGRVRAASQVPAPTCIVCSSSGALGKGNRWPLPTRVNA